MSVAVNPTNPLNVVGVAIDQAPNPQDLSVYYSRDGGTTWNRTPIDAAHDGLGTGKRGDPSVGFEANGDLFVSYAHQFTAPDGTPMTSVVVARSTDGGQSFAQYTTVEAGPDISQGNLPGVDEPSLTTGFDPLSGQQAVYVAYSENIGPTEQRVVVAGSRDGGATFTAPVRVSQPGDDGLRAVIAQGPGGQLYVAWNHYKLPNQEILFNSDPFSLWDSSGSFGADVPVHTFSSGVDEDFKIPAQPSRGISFDPSIAVDGSGDRFEGRVYIAFTDFGSSGGVDDTDVFLTSSDDQGAHWQPVGSSGNVASSTGSEFLPTVAVDQSTGSVNVLYYTTDGFQGSGNASVNVRLATSLDGGATFQHKQLSGESSNAGAATLMNGFDFGEYIGLAVFDNTAHGFWAANRDATAGTEGEYARVLRAWTATAYLAGDNTLTLNLGFQDTLTIRLDPANPSFLEALDNNQIVFDGLAAGVKTILITTGGGVSSGVVNVVSLPAGVEVDVELHDSSAVGPTTVNVGSDGTPGSHGTMAAVQGTVHISNTTLNPTVLNIDDSGDSNSYSNVEVASDASLSNGHVSGLGSG
jgi:hypothetical protein